MLVKGGYCDFISSGKLSNFASSNVVIISKSFIFLSNSDNISSTFTLNLFKWFAVFTIKLFNITVNLEDG